MQIETNWGELAGFAAVMTVHGVYIKATIKSATSDLAAIIAKEYKLKSDCTADKRDCPGRKR